MLLHLPIAIIAAFCTYFLARKNDSKYKELPETLTYSGFWRRFFASVIDYIISTSILTLIFSLYSYKYSDSTMVYSEEYPDQDFSTFILRQSYAAPLFFTFAWLLDLSYFILQQASSHQATIGMRFMGIKTYDSQLNKANVWVLVGRHLSMALSCVPFFIGFFMIGWTRRNQALHDKIAKTVVCRQW